MSFIPGLDLNTQLELEANKVAMGVFAAGAVGLAGMLGIIPQEFATVKKPDDILKVGSGLLLGKLAQMVVQESGQPQQPSQQAQPVSQPPASTVADW